MSKKIKKSFIKFKEKVYSSRLRILFSDNSLSKENFSADVKKGLSAKRKYLHPKYFYDTEGSALFDKICKTREYYPTRTEESILKKFSDEIREYNSGINHIVELGSGSSAKTRYLLKSFLKANSEVFYIPVDVSEVIIPGSVNLLKAIKNLTVLGINSNYENGLLTVSERIKKSKLIIFLGSSIGNFTFTQAKSFLKTIRKNMTDKDSLLIGFDMVKDIRILTEAYNDRKQFTAAFNLNILKRINKELGGNFNLNKFSHKAFFNSRKSRIEMHLVSKENQTVKIKEIDFKAEFRKEETIHTENSHKFTVKLIKILAGSARFKPVKMWKDKNKYFSVVLFRKV